MLGAFFSSMYGKVRKEAPTLSIPDFSAVVSSLSTAMTMAKGFFALKSEAERQQLVIDLQKKILEAQALAMGARNAQDGLIDEVNYLNGLIKGASQPKGDGGCDAATSRAWLSSR